MHLHHGIEKPDTPENLRRTLVEFRDALADEHQCLSRLDDKGSPMYAFVHGNLALANSAGASSAVWIQRCRFSRRLAVTQT